MNTYNIIAFTVLFAVIDPFTMQCAQSKNPSFKERGQKTVATLFSTKTTHQQNKPDSTQSTPASTTSPQAQAATSPATAQKEIEKKMAELHQELENLKQLKTKAFSSTTAEAENKTSSLANAAEKAQQDIQEHITAQEDALTTQFKNMQKQFEELKTSIPPKPEASEKKEPEKSESETKEPEKKDEDNKGLGSKTLGWIHDNPKWILPVAFFGLSSVLGGAGVAEGIDNYQNRDDSPHKLRDEGELAATGSSDLFGDNDPDNRYALPFNVIFSYNPPGTPIEQIKEHIVQYAKAQNAPPQTIDEAPQTTPALPTEVHEEITPAATTTTINLLEDEKEKLRYEKPTTPQAIESVQEQISDLTKAILELKNLIPSGLSAPAQHNPQPSPAPNTEAPQTAKPTAIPSDSQQNQARENIARIEAPSPHSPVPSGEKATSDTNIQPPPVPTPPTPAKIPKLPWSTILNQEISQPAPLPR